MYNPASSWVIIERGVGRSERSGRNHTKVVFEEGRERTRGRVVLGRGLGRSHGKGVVERVVVVVRESWGGKWGYWGLLGWVWVYLLIIF
jgi:hypothetical protein